MSIASRARNAKRPTSSAYRHRYIWIGRMSMLDDTVTLKSGAKYRMGQRGWNRIKSEERS